MNARETPSLQEQPEAVNLDDLANEHCWRVESLRDMLIHLEAYCLNEISITTRGVEALNALVFGAKDLAIQAAKEADRFAVSVNAFRRHLMDMPEELLVQDDADSSINVVRGALRIITGAAASQEDLEDALEMAADIVDADVGFEDDLATLTRIVEMRGYTVSWLSTLTQRAARVTPRRDVARLDARADVTPVDARTYLTAEEITMAARAMVAGLEGYLIAALSHPANSAI